MEPTNKLQVLLCGPIWRPSLKFRGVKPEPTPKFDLDNSGEWDKLEIKGGGTLS